MIPSYMNGQTSVGAHPHVVLVPGMDGEYKMVSPQELAQLYGVPFERCLVWDTSGRWVRNGHMSSWRPYPWDVCLYPAQKGQGYALPEKAREILAKVAP